MSKYYSTKTEVNGISFDSKLEAERFKQLLLLQQAGEIANLKLQQEFQISQGFKDINGEKIRSSFYMADFTYTDTANHLQVAEDTKGIETPEFKLKWKLVKSRYPEWTFRKIKKDEL